jgi:hypothetical protein
MPLLTELGIIPGGRYKDVAPTALEKFSRNAKAQREELLRKKLPLKSGAHDRT